MSKTILKIVGEFAALLVGVAIALAFYFVGHATYDIQIEAGQTVSANDFWSGAWNPTFTEKYPVPDTKDVGIYPLEVSLGGPVRYNASVTIVDTEMPVLEVKDLTLNHGETAAITDFVVKAEDNSRVSLYYEVEPDFEIAGEQPLTIYASDAAGNTVSENVVLFMSCIYDHVTTELNGTLPDVKLFLVDPTMEASYVNPPSGEELVVGDQTVKVKVGGKTYDTILTLEDTTAPVVTTQVVNGWINEVQDPSVFVTGIEDATECTVAFVETPDYSSLGTKTVKIVVTDACGNESVVTSEVKVAEDTTAPFIFCNGISATVGTTISYRSAISVSDDHDGLMTNFTIDTSSVDVSKAGTYTVTCTATDSAGNTATKDIVVTINNAVVAFQPTLEDVYAEADKIIAQIITPGMDKVAQVTAIYNWTRSHISYRYGSDKTNWVKTAYDGFTKRSGDCFTYASTSMAMLNRLGITSQFVIKEQQPWTTQSQHFWLIVDYGMGYYHYDSCPRRTGYNFCLIGDTELYNYSNNPATRREQGSHNFTRELYPYINP